MAGERTVRVYEYRTTHGQVYQEQFYTSLGVLEDAQEPDDPIVPDGEGWDLVNTSASSVRLYWTWRRLARRSRKGKQK